MTDFLPRLKTQAFLRASIDARVPKEQQPAVYPFCGDLWVAYATESSSDYRFLSERELAIRGYSLAAAFDVAVSNLCRKFDAIGGFGIRQRGDLYVVEAAENLAATAMLDTDFWKQGIARFHNSIVAAAPHRDSLFFACGLSARSLSELEEAVSRCNFDDTHALSKHLYVFDGSWSAFGRHEQIKDR